MTGTFGVVGHAVATVTYPDPAFPAPESDDDDATEEADDTSGE